MDNEETFSTKQYSFRDSLILKKLFVYIRPYLFSFILIVFLDIFVNAAFMMNPLITAKMIDFLKAYTNGEIAPVDPMRSMSFYILLDVAFWFICSFGGFFVNIALKRIGQKVVRDMRNELFSHVLSLSLSDLKKLRIGSYVTRITNDTQNISSLFSDILPQALRASLSLLIIIVTTFVMTKFYGFVFLAYIPIVFLVSFFFQRKARRFYRDEKRAISEMNSFLSESFQGIKVTKTYANESKKQKEFDVRNASIQRSFLKAQYNFAVFYPFMFFLQISCILLIFALCIPNIDAPDARISITIGTFQMLFSYASQFFQPIQTITQLLNVLQQTISSAERILFVDDITVEDNKEEGKIDVPSFKGKIEFRHVSFAYENDFYVLRDVSFIIQPGETAAFVGATGAGKSTIISLISKTYVPQQGEILIDDININDYSLDCLRRNIGIMLQDVFLFSGTIKENISLGDKSISEETIIAGAKEVGADSFIEQFDDKYDHAVTQRGENFSAGQRQLLSFARTLVYHPSLVLLDEATANIDTETEHIIQASLEKMRSIGTMVIVAHRLSTIKNADQIYVVRKGKIIEHGTHQDLLKMKGNYYNLYQLQNMERHIDSKEEMQHE